MSESKVSVILTSYNRPLWLKDAIDSVINQTHQNWEMFIIDDNSPNVEIDNLALRYDDDRIFFFKTSVSDEDRVKTCRYATNINFALKLCSGIYISYLTDDDDYLPHRLELMANYLDHNKDVNVVYGKQYCYYDGEHDIPIPWVRETHGVLQSASCVVDHNSVMHRKSVINQIGLWEDGPEYWGFADAVFWTKLTSAGHYFYPIDEVLDRHRFHHDSVQSKLSRGINII